MSVSAAEAQADLDAMRGIVRRQGDTEEDHLQADGVLEDAIRRLSKGTETEAIYDELLRLFWDLPKWYA